MLGLIDAAALAPLALPPRRFPGQTLAARIGLAALAGVGVGAGAVVLGHAAVGREQATRRATTGRWLRTRTASFREASQAWALVSMCWLMRTVGLLLLLGALGVGFSLPVALLFLCASSAAAALPVGPGRRSHPGRRGRSGAHRVRCRRRRTQWPPPLPSRRWGSSRVGRSFSSLLHGAHLRVGDDALRPGSRARSGLSIVRRRDVAGA